MQQMKWAPGVGLAYVYALLLVMGGHAIARDSLLFHSDPLSLATYVAAAATVVVPALLVLSAPVLLLAPAWRRRLFTLASLAAAAIIGMAFVVLASLFLSSLLELGLAEKVASRPRDSLGVMAIIPLAFGVLIWRHGRRAALVERVGRVGLAIFVAIVVGLPVSLGYHHLSRGLRGTTAEDGGRHLVLLVLDGMPAQYLSAYDPGAVPTPMDRVVEDALVFRQMRTSAPFTYGFFGTLYSGRSELVFGGAAGPHGPGGNLISRLQRSGVVARWMAYHRNGIPEASAGRISAYRGLRSYFLTHNYAWIPEVLGLDYHLTIAGRAIAQNLTNRAVVALFEALNTDVRVENAFVDILVPQLRMQRRRAGRTFTLFHIAWGAVGSADVFSKNELPVAWEDETAGDGKPGALRAIRVNDYRYGEEYEVVARRRRGKTLVTMGVLGRHLQAFQEALAADEAIRDTTVIVTSDHGRMFRKGRFWYGYHPNEEVVRVPLIVLNGGAAGIDDRYFATPDLAESVLAFFDVPAGLDPRALSIFDSRTHRSVASATLRSDKNKEWFLVLIRDGRKYQVNIHPEGDGKTRILDVDRFDETLIEETVGLPADIVGLFTAELERFGLRRDEIHPALR